MTANEFLTILFAGVSLFIVQILFGCASLPPAATLLPEAGAAASVLMGHGPLITVNVMSGNTTCKCSPCPK